MQSHTHRQTSIYKHPLWDFYIFVLDQESKDKINEDTKEKQVFQIIQKALLTFTLRNGHKSTSKAVLWNHPPRHYKHISWITQSCKQHWQYAGNHRFALQVILTYAKQVY